MTTYEQIKAGAEMGHSATLESECWGAMQIIGITTNFIQVRLEDGVHEFKKHSAKKWEITGWLYAGELLGNTIPIGAKFRVKGTETVVELNKNGTYNSINDHPLILNGKYKPQELEPYFN